MFYVKERFEHSCGIVPLQQSRAKWRVLLILQGRTWSFPKGHVETGELPKQTAERELREETNLQIEKYLANSPFEERYTFAEHQIRVHKSVLFFPALVTGELKVQLEELLDAIWVPLELAGSKLTHTSTRHIWQQVRELTAQN